MSSSYELRIVIGLIVLCVFNSFFVEAQGRNLFKKVFKINPSAKIPPTLSPQKFNLHVLKPDHSSQTVINSMTSVNLQSKSPIPSTSTNLHRSASSPLLNKADSPSIIKEMSTTDLHKQAAIALNRNIRVSLPRQNNPSFLQRALPDMKKLSKIGKTYIKNGAITAAGVGGVVIVVKAVIGNEQNVEKKEQNENENHSTTEKIPTTTRSSEYYNQMGEDK